MALPGAEQPKSEGKSKIKRHVHSPWRCIINSTCRIRGFIKWFLSLKMDPLIKYGSTAQFLHIQSQKVALLREKVLSHMLWSRQLLLHHRHLPTPPLHGVGSDSAARELFTPLSPAPIALVQMLLITWTFWTETVCLQTAAYPHPLTCKLPEGKCVHHRGSPA